MACGLGQEPRQDGLADSALFPADEMYHAHAASFHLNLAVTLLGSTLFPGADVFLV